MCSGVTFDVIVICGPTGCGKSSIGTMLAQELGWIFKDGDALHSTENIEKMRRGEPLTDVDRYPWLSEFVLFCTTNKPAVIACSALKKKYRDFFRKNLNCRFVLLDLPRELLISRVSSRQDHFMPLCLVDNQLKTLEKPMDEPDVLTISVIDRTTPTQITNMVRRSLGI